MIQALMRSMITFIDLTALAALIGAAWCQMWVMRREVGGAEFPKAFLDRIRLLLIVCITALVISGIGDLAFRAAEMSGFGIASILPVLPTVLLKTHYGSMWLARLAGLAAAWTVSWAGKGHAGSRLITTSMLFAGAVIAFSRSASGHAADFGDGSPQQIADWLHLLAAASWGGTLLALASVIPPSVIMRDDLPQRTIAGIADRFYFLFGPALAVSVLTGAYSAWIEVGSFKALLSTPYGRVFSVKLAIFLLLAFRYIAPPKHGQEEFATRFLHRVRADALLVLAVLLCVAIFTHQIPARHSSHLMPHHTHMMEMAE